MTDQKTDYYSVTNRRFLFVLWAHVPLAVLTAWLCHTSLAISLFVALGIVAGPTVAVLRDPKGLLTSIMNAVALVSYSALLIYSSGGMTELHFHIFASFGVMIMLAQPLAVLSALVFVVVHHVGLFFILPKALINYNASFGILVVHALFALGIAIPAFFIARTFKKYIVGVKELIGEIEELSQGLNDASQVVQQTSQDMLTASQSEAAALQQTSAAIEELTSMIARNTESANSAAENVQSSKQNSNKTLQVMDSVVGSLNDIVKTNEQIEDAVAQSNSRIEEIVGMMADIGSKTKVINDIVFQTKLLSFNASVEAARAGAHGQGFAVVAEEIGKLALMSGSSAKEISDLIDQSVRSAREIVGVTKSSINEIVTVSKVKIDQGQKVVYECKDLMTDIDTRLSEINIAASTIATACREQSTGVSEMSRAMHDISKASQQNASVSVRASEVATSLVKNTTHLDEVVTKLVVEIDSKAA